MTKSELIEALAKKKSHLAPKDIDQAVDSIIKHMCQALIANDRGTCKIMPFTLQTTTYSNISRINTTSCGILQVPRRFNQVFKSGLLNPK